MRVCARVLAAALMTGAIAGAVAFPALFGQGSGPHRALIAPPSSQLRTLRVPALTAPAQHHAVQAAQPRARGTRAALATVKIAPSAAAVHGFKAVPPRTTSRPTPPPPEPAPAPAPSAPAPSATPPAEAQAAPASP